MSLSSYDRHSQEISFYDYAQGCSGQLIPEFSEEDNSILGYFVKENTYSSCNLTYFWTYSFATFSSEGDLQTISGPSPDRIVWTIIDTYDELYSDGTYYTYYSESLYGVPSDMEFEFQDYEGDELYTLSTSDYKKRTFQLSFSRSGTSQYCQLNSKFDRNGELIGLTLQPDDGRTYYLECELVSGVIYKFDEDPNGRKVLDL